MANVTTPTESTLPVAGGDIVAAPLSGWITNLKNFVEGANIDENNVDYTSFDGIVVKAQTQTLSGAKTFSSVITATAGLISGSTILSDTDSTDDLGSTSKRWANVYTDSLGDTGQALAVKATTLSFDAASTIDTSGNNNLTLDAGTATLTLDAATIESDATTLSFDAAATIDTSGNNQLTINTGSANLAITTAKVVVSGDLEVTGDDLFMGTNTSGHLLIADGTNYNPTALSGDVTVNASGVTAISSDVIVNADIKSDAAIADSKLATISTSNKVSGSAVQLASTTAIENSSGLQIKSAIAGTGLSLSSQVLSVDAAQTQITSVGTLSALTVSGLITASGGVSGTTGTFSGDLAVATSALFVDASTGGDVGIGTTSIASGGANTRNVTIHNSNSEATYFKLSNNATGTTNSDGFDFIAGADGQAYIYNRENAILNFATNSTIAAKILANGDFTVDDKLYVDVSDSRVGINTSSPQRPLHVDGTEGVARFTSTASGNNGLEVGIGTSSQAFIWQAENSYLQFATNNTERLRISADGHMGLRVAPNSNWTTGNATLQVGAEGALWSPVAASASNAFSLSMNGYYNGSAWKYITTGGYASQYYQNAGGHYFRSANASGTADADISYSHVLTILRDGKTGIGTVSPTEKMDVTGAVKASAAANNWGYSASFFDRSGNDTRVVAGATSGNSSNIAFWTYNSGTQSQKAVITNDGKVGIGADSPTHKLTVVGSINNGIHVTADTDTDFDPDSGYANDALILKNSTAGNNNPVSLYFATGSNGEVRFSAIDDATSGDANLNLSLRRSGGSRANVQFWEAGTGFVGIGTTTPTGTLELSSTATDTNFIMGGTPSSGSREPWRMQAEGDYLRIGQNKSSFAKYLTIYGSSVGIGTEAPTHTLSLSTTGTDGLKLGVDSQTYYHIIRPNGDGLYIGADDGNTGGTGSDIRFNVKGTECLRITDDGDLLIGETSDQIARVYATTSTTGDYAYIGVTTGADRGPVSFANTSGSFNDIMFVLTSSRASTTDYDFARYNNTTSMVYKVEGDGGVSSDVGFTTPAADYAEYFESSTGKSSEVGRPVVLDGDKIRYYNAETDSAENIIGVTRPKLNSKNSGFIGNSAWNNWQGKFLTDDWGVYVLEDITVWTYTNEKNETFDVYERDELAKDPNWTPPEGATSSTQSVRKLNPDYDESLEETYKSRRARDEWWLIGLLGQIQVKAGEPVNPRWIKMKNISDAVELYYVR